MNEKGFTLIESLLFFTIIVLMIHYLCVITCSLSRLDEIGITNKDFEYENAYE